MIEKHYTIKEIAGVLQLSLERTRQLVMKEPGVLRLAPEGNARKFKYRIPESVLARILKRSANPA